MFARQPVIHALPVEAGPGSQRLADTCQWPTKPSKPRPSSSVFGMISPRSSSGGKGWMRSRTFVSTLSSPISA
jgi:hypothetical protein